MLRAKAPAQGKLRELRVLLVEDSWLLADLLAVRLEEEGAFVQGPFSKACDAIAHLQDNTIDIALVDMVLKDSCADGLIDWLIERGVPYAIMTGYQALPTNAGSAAIAVLQKPLDLKVLVTLLSKFTGSTRTGAA